MRTKLSAAAMSTALITGLVLSGPAANAEVMSDEVVSTPTESSTSVDAPTEPDASQSPVADVVEPEESILPADPEAMLDAEEPVVAEEVRTHGDGFSGFARI